MLFEPPDGSAIDASLARRLIDSQFPQWSHLPITSVELNGWDNRSFRLGSELTVRLPSGNWYARQVEKEQRWLPVLAPQLPLPIPIPVAKGEPDTEFPYPWSVYRWLEGEPAANAHSNDLTGFATTLAGFLNALGRIDATDGPAPGKHNFYRGGPLATYEEETVQAIDALADEIPTDDVKRVWADAMASCWKRDPVWSTAMSPPETCWSEMLGWRRCSTSGHPASAIRPATRSSPGRFSRGRAETAFGSSSTRTRARGHAAGAGPCGRR
jgi:aminoglycoside phosphotransferase (APT) family kinase protein